MSQSTIVAALDIGTNSTKATVARVEDGAVIEIVREMSDITRLGKGVDSSGRLDDAAIARTVDTVVRFVEEARALGAVRIAAAGTSALRDAQNGRDFLDAVRQRTHIDVEIVSGDREAQLAYGAVQKDPSMGLRGESRLLVFDIGGGSTELIVGSQRRIDQHASLDIGAVRLTERCVKADPPSDAEVAAIRAAARPAIARLNLPGGLCVAGIGGTALNTAAIAVAARTGAVPSKETLHGSTVTAADVAGAMALCRRAPIDERRRIPGLEPERADVIIAGMAILETLLAETGADGFRLSIRGLRYGLLAETAALAL